MAGSPGRGAGRGESVRGWGETPDVKRRSERMLASGELGGYQ